MRRFIEGAAALILYPLFFLIFVMAEIIVYWQFNPLDTNEAMWRHWKELYWE